MALQKSPLHARHIALEAKLVPFGGWEMPLAYPTGTIQEHRACRNSAAMFDVSHLGTVRVSGDDAFDRLQRTLTNDLGRIGPGRAQYTHMLDETGSVLDDIIVWWVEAETFDVMPNASNTDRVREATSSAESDVRIVDVTNTRALVAVQGPEARARLAEVCSEAAEVSRFTVAGINWRGTDILVAGTGYTGEDGVECSIPRLIAGEFWDALLVAGVTPAGLGARDTLRLEAGLPLYGNELGPGITPLQAGLGWVVRWDKGDFTGRDALERERREGPSRKLRGISVDGRRPPRSGQKVRSNGREVGVVTSGNFSPSLGHGIALAYLESTIEVGAHVDIEARGTTLEGTVVKTPFFKAR